LLSNHLIASGVPVFKFDYFGTGDSMGGSDDWDLDTWTSSIMAAAAEFRNRANVREVSVVALRFGAVLAALALERGLTIRDLVLWDPVVLGATYLDQVRTIHRREISEQTSTLPFPDEADLDVDPHELAGFLFKPSITAAITASSLLDRSFAGSQRVSLCVSESRPEYGALAALLRSKGKEGGYHVVHDLGNWEDYSLWDTSLLPSRILEVITEVLTGGKA
jgi:pimeloyl-ACP methyl ester carboxylesterase